MKLKAVYLPTSDPIEDGSVVINRNGEHFTYRETDHWDMKGIRVAELFVVTEEYNERVVIGKPSDEAMKWVKAGMEFKGVDCEVRDNNIVYIKCPCCGKV